MAHESEHLQTIDIAAALRNGAELSPEVFWLGSISGKTIFTDERTGKYVSFLVSPDLGCLRGDITLADMPTEGEKRFDDGTVMIVLDWSDCGFDSWGPFQEGHHGTIAMKRMVDIKLRESIYRLVDFRRTLDAARR